MILYTSQQGTQPHNSIAKEKDILKQARVMQNPPQKGGKRGDIYSHRRGRAPGGWPCQPARRLAAQRWSRCCSGSSPSGTPALGCGTRSARALTCMLFHTRCCTMRSASMGDTNEGSSVGGARINDDTNHWRTRCCRALLQVP